MNPQGQRPKDVGEDLPDACKPSDEDEDRDKQDKGKNAKGKEATRDHAPGKT